MKILIDTNVIIDYLVDHTPFADHAEQVLELCGSGKVEGSVTSSALFLWCMSSEQIEFAKIIIRICGGGYYEISPGGD